MFGHMHAHPSFVVSPATVTAHRLLSHQRASSSIRPRRRYVAAPTWRAAVTNPSSEADAATPPTPPRQDSDPSRTPAAEAPVSKSDDSANIFGDFVAGKIVLTEQQLVEQKAALNKYAEMLRTDRLRTEREASRLFGWVPYAETMNGRFAMIFFLTGLLTEYWTDYTIPEQIELLLRTLGFF